jgi:hypothetical protein
MVTLLAFVVLGGAAYAAFHLPRNSVRSSNIVNGQVKSKDIARAAQKSLRARCPKGMKLVGKAHDLCVDGKDRPADNWTDALTACQAAGLRLPSPAEALEAHVPLGASQYWTDSPFLDGSIHVAYAYNGVTNVIFETARTDTFPVRCVATPSDG